MSACQMARVHKCPFLTQNRAYKFYPQLILLEENAIKGGCLISLTE